MSYGLVEGDACNRNGCAGVMEEIESDGGCSCHIHPPCSYCVDMEYECSECGHNSVDDWVELRDNANDKG